MVGTCRHIFVKICAETYLLVPSGAGRRDINRQKGGVIDLDTALFNGCFQPKIPSFVPFQDRSKKFHHWRPVYGRTAIMPSSVSRDAHIDIATEGRIAGWAASSISGGI